MLWQNASATTVATAMRGHGPGPFQAEQLTDRACTLPAAAERGEVMLAQARPGCLVHVADGEPPGVPQGLVPAQGSAPAGSSQTR